jgi:hypothetical protein
VSSPKHGGWEDGGGTCPTLSPFSDVHTGTRKLGESRVPVRWKDILRGMSYHEALLDTEAS